MTNETNSRGGIGLGEVIRELQRVVERCAESEATPMLRAIMRERIDLSHDNIAKSIEEGLVAGDIVRDTDGAVVLSQSIVATGEVERLTEYIERSLRETQQSCAREEIAGDDPVLMREQLVAWYDATMHAAMWLKRASVKPDEAAMLLCRIDPLGKKDPATIYPDGDEESPDRYRVLLRVFLDVAETDPAPRPLLAWRDVAKHEQLRYHGWFDEYEQAVRHQASLAPSGALEKGSRTIHLIADDEATKGKVANRFIEQVANELEKAKKVVAVSTIYVEMSNRQGNSIVIDSKPEGLVCDVGETEPVLVTKSVIKGVLERRRKRKSEHG
jgi:hypothetical protein